MARRSSSVSGMAVASRRGPVVTARCAGPFEFQQRVAGVSRSDRPVRAVVDQVERIDSRFCLQRRIVSAAVPNCPRALWSIRILDCAVAAGGLATIDRQTVPPTGLAPPRRLPSPTMPGDYGAHELSADPPEDTAGCDAGGLVEHFADDAPREERVQARPATWTAHRHRPGSGRGNGMPGDAALLATAGRVLDGIPAGVRRYKGVVHHVDVPSGCCHCRQSRGSARFQRGNGQFPSLRAQLGSTVRGAGVNGLCELGSSDVALFSTVQCDVAPIRRIQPFRREKYWVSDPGTGVAHPLNVPLSAGVPNGASLHASRWSPVTAGSGYGPSKQCYLLTVISGGWPQFRGATSHRTRLQPQAPRRVDLQGASLRSAPASRG